MKKMNLRDANQQFSKLAREVEETGQTILVLRNGKPALKLAPIDEVAPRLSKAQREAKQRLMDPSSRFTTPDGWKFSREEMYDEAVLRHGVVRRMWQAEEKKKRRRG
ncbi:MAG: type II toxin-antitoxin system Phd/YefM family antitoxin [Alphaproteobacteria bacterium]|nr:type II toxin-antitoxin system Phd/YefM family antitoxin [Alphaproteobacteria bacterium]MBV9419940.1 type II toxin-antitoxin system Phd/YefM family antitoxin [Alphaproteobacteria bacterium]MBV9542431.1 type II toxin-antitoxin system Phd/YefM family antitoxin [Alphaproteobacteria bacterium]MBV9905269.1 type II toxin-antitoxin system Phd/YefM family antitoxin [Alphaproteobacteria bacterium]